MGEYKQALVLKMQEDPNFAATEQLQSVAGFEASMGSALHDMG
jgi:hypothetical protein